jgi:hypothetical protein
VDCTIVTSSVSNASITTTNSNFFNCILRHDKTGSGQTALKQLDGNTFRNCQIISNSYGYLTTTTQYNKFYDCSITATEIALFGGTSNGLNGLFENCTIISNANHAIDLFYPSNYLFLLNCVIEGQIDCVNLTRISAAASNRQAGTVNLFSQCTMYANTGVIWNEPVSYDVGDLGVIFSNNNLYNKDFTALIPQKLVESVITINTGLQEIKQ